MAEGGGEVGRAGVGPGHSTPPVSGPPADPGRLGSLS